MMKKQLLIATASIGLVFSAFSVQASAQNHKVQSGDTLWKIASSNNISIQDLKTWNNLHSDSIYVGQHLVVTAPTAIYYDSYIVKSGDTLALIAKKYQTTVTQIKSANQLNSDMIYIGQLLKVPSAPPKTYTVQSGDSLWIIATKFGLTVNQVKSFNGLTSDAIYVGQVLKLTSSSVSTFNADALIAEGKKYIGVPYVWGGNTPSGFDCSGFLSYVYGKVNVSIPRTVESLWNATTPVSSPQKGDLVFYTTYKAGPSHAGIYVGNNQFLHAGSSTGVTITDMNNPYWKARYLGAKKVN